MVCQKLWVGIVFQGGHHSKKKTLKPSATLCLYNSSCVRSHDWRPRGPRVSAAPFTLSTRCVNVLDPLDGSYALCSLWKKQGLAYDYDNILNLFVANLLFAVLTPTIRPLRWGNQLLIWLRVCHWRNKIWFCGTYSPFRPQGKRFDSCRFQMISGFY